MLESIFGIEPKISCMDLHWWIYVTAVRMFSYAAKHCKLQKLRFQYISLHFNTDRLRMCSCGRTYTPSLEDVGSYLALYWLPTCADGKCGKPLVTISDSPVNPGISCSFCKLEVLGLSYDLASLQKRNRKLSTVDVLNSLLMLDMNKNTCCFRKP